MRSIGFTLLLALVAAVACGLAGWTMVRGSFAEFFGAPPASIGQPLFPDFKAEKVQRMKIASKGMEAVFVRKPHGWQAVTPWDDRMDPRALVAIVQFTQAIVIQDRAPADEVKRVELGLEENEAISIAMEDSDGNPLVHYRLGHRSPWLAEIPDVAEPVPTVFIEPLGPSDDGHVYTCAGDILPLFNEGFRFLQDHHPFIPQPLQRIRIRANEGELTLARDQPGSAWRIIKPLPLPTDPPAMTRLIDGLVNLKAVRVAERASVTLPTASPTTPPHQISIVPFGSETETTLEIYPPESPEARTTLATVSDRPGTVFELPFKPESELVSLADLPLSVNDLRDATLTNLNVRSLASVAIRPSTGAEILLSVSPPQPWMATIGGVTRPANEQRIFDLLKAVTEGRAIEFKTDAATDFAPWGLDRPFLRLLFLSIDHQTLELNFGMDTRGEIFVNRAGTPTVMRIDRSLLDQITVRAHEWRHARLWSLNRVYLVGIKRTVPGKPPLTLAYQFLDESWRGLREGTDISDEIDPARANFLLSAIESPEVSRWLAPDDAAAAAALIAPSLVLEVVEKAVDDQGGFIGTTERKLEIAPAPDQPGFYYGRLTGEAHPFLLDSQTYDAMATDPLDAK